MGIIWVLLALLPFRAAARDRDAFQNEPPAPLPEPSPMEIEVPRGGPVLITLSAYSLTSPIVRFRIKRTSTAGKLGTPQLASASTATVRYQPPAGAGPDRDSFTFSVQSDAGVSAPAEVKIRITDKDPVLITPGDIEFGQVLPGQSARQVLEIQNIGGGLAQGRLETPEGWSVDGDGAYRVGPGEKQRFTITFKPAEARVYTGDITYTGNPERATDLNGAGVAPLAVATGPVQLTGAGPVRAGAIHVENRTESAQKLKVIAGPNLQADEAAEVPSKGSTDIIVREKETRRSTTVWSWMAMT